MMVDRAGHGNILTCKGIVYLYFAAMKIKSVADKHCCVLGLM